MIPSKNSGSRIDRHEKIGDGLLAESLKLFVQHETMKNVPIIMELPVMEEEKKKILQMVRVGKK